MDSHNPPRNIPKDNYYICTIDIGEINTALRIEHQIIKTDKVKRRPIFQGLFDLSHGEYESISFKDDIRFNMEKGVMINIVKVFDVLSLYLDDASYIFIEQQLNINTKAVRIEAMILSHLATRYFREGPYVISISPRLKTKFLEKIEISEDKELKKLMKGAKSEQKKLSIAHAYTIDKESLDFGKVDDVSDTIVYCSIGIQYIKEEYRRMTKKELQSLLEERGLSSKGKKDDLIERLEKLNL